MDLVKASTKVLEFVTKKALSRAESRNARAVKQLKSVKGKVDKSAVELKLRQAEAMIQLTKITLLGREIGQKAEIQAGKASKINALLQDIDD